jgi:hypothetical protein
MMFLRAHVIYFVGKRRAALRHLTILAAIMRPLTNLLAERGGHYEAGRSSFRESRALACIRSRN